MPLQLPTDIEALVQKRLATGAYANGEDVLRHALEVQEAQESWTADERSALDAKIDRAMNQAAEGRTFSPQDARAKLAEMRLAHLSYLNR